MFSKAPRFRGARSNSPEGRAKSPNLGGRESTRPESQDADDDFQSGFTMKRIPGTESEQATEAKRPLSTDRKTSSQDKKRGNQRELKRTTSYIPRATSHKGKQPESGEVKKSGRKSETSLKDKDVFDDSGTKEKRFDGFKSGKQGLGLKQKKSIENNDIPRKREISPKVHSSGKGAEGGQRETPQARLGKSTQSKLLHSSEGPNRSQADRPDSKIHKTRPSPSVEDHQPVSKSLEAQYVAKKTVYSLMIKEYHEKQKSITDQHKALQDLRKKVMTMSGKELPQEESIRITELGPPFVIDISEKVSDQKNGNIVTYETKVLNDLSVDFTDFQSTFDSLVHQNREIWAELTHIFINSRRDIVKKAIEQNPDLDLSEFEEEEKSLEMAIESAKYHSKLKMDDLMVEMKKLYSNREIIKQELSLLLNNEKSLAARECKELAAKLKEVEEELAKEKVRTEDLTEKRNLLEETKLAESEKVENLEQVVTSQQNKLMQLAFQCKALKQKELVANRGIGGIKAKEIKDLKAKSELLKGLEIHITELTNDYNAQKKTFQTRITELEQSLSEKEEALKAEIQNRQSLEVTLADAEEKLRNVREKKKVFAEMVDKTKQILHNTNSSTSKREEQLWTELEATKIVVKGYQEQLAKLTEEKNKILLKFQTISEDKSNQNAERLAADLVRKEEIIKNLKDQVTELQRACEEHSAKYNKLLAQIKEVHEKMDGKTDAAALSKQLGDVKMQKKELQEVVKELVTHNEELETALVQRTLELDQRDRLVKQQCNLLKMRDELTDLVRGKDDVQYQGVKKVLEQSSRWEKKAEKIYKDLEKKANELDDMYKVLVEKQKQIEKLTKLVKIMEDQQDRAQEQRVRFESKIAELQKQLSEGQPKLVKASLFGN